ncbi:MAG: ParM/StbA family protein [Gammaproteobacteria bacterium]|uniref:Uncharacterized protein n=1 Tax=viral metagenome TaxID=1070528 RepID=A0A6H1ZX87_9ZZZZ|nr:ParM/StbA family protein [Gammaproteobacteria bacterium]
MNIGLDIGYAATKAVSGERRINLPSIVGTPDRARFSLNGADSMILTLPNGNAVQVGQAAIMQSRFIDRQEDRDWIQSETYQALMLAALTELTPATIDAVIVSGLPIAFYSDKDLLRGRLLGEHRVAREGRRAQLFRVTEARIIPQPFGTLLAEALDNNGRITDLPLAEGQVGVIDCGGKTTNLLSVSRLAEIGHETASVNLGAWDVARAVGDWLADNYPGLDLRDHQLMEAIIARKTTYYGEVVDLGAIVSETLRPMADQVLAQAGQLWNGGAGLSAILVTGGGALLLGPQIMARFRHARIVGDPVFANALGYWKFAQRIANSG